MATKKPEHAPSCDITRYGKRGSMMPTLCTCGGAKRINKEKQEKSGMAILKFYQRQITYKSALREIMAIFGYEVSE